jgi:hypothetical protein
MLQSKILNIPKDPEIPIQRETNEIIVQEIRKHTKQSLVESFQEINQKALRDTFKILQKKQLPYLKREPLRFSLDSDEIDDEVGD